MTSTHRAAVDAIADLCQTELTQVLDVVDILSNDDLDTLYTRLGEVLSYVQQVWADRDDPTECENCATPISRDELGRPRQYCSNACRQSAYRQRQR